MEQATVGNQLVYVVDDDEYIGNLIVLTLQSRGYRAKQFRCGQTMLEDLGNTEPDLIILDIVMPGANGVEITQQVRQFSEVPIMMLSGRDDVKTKAMALNVGADDYLTKPFEVEELLARVQAILRRSAPASNDHQGIFYRCGDLCVDLNSGVVTVHDQPVKLTPHEWGMLKVLVKYAGQVVKPRYLLREVWGPDYGDEGDYIRAYITRLRRKVEPDPKQPRYILLERGFGYRMADPDEAIQGRQDAGHAKD